MLDFKCNLQPYYLLSKVPVCTQKYKYIDDLSILEVINLILNGISSYNAKQQVPSDIKIGNKFIHSDNFQTQNHLNKISYWTKKKEMKLNGEKINYMLFNFSKEYQFNTRLYMEHNLLNQVRETHLLGVIVSDNLKWHSNIASLVTRCYQRMTILRNLNTFHVPVGEMVNIYCLYIRSVAEQSSVVWSSSITSGEEYDLERIQKVALRVILKENYYKCTIPDQPKNTQGQKSTTEQSVCYEMQ